MTATVVLHVPHSATVIPADVRPRLLVSERALRRQLLLMTDWFTDELFALPASEAVMVRFPVSRLVVDPERFLEDDREVMAARGLGVIYTRTSDGEPLREAPSPAERADLLGRSACASSRATAASRCSPAASRRSSLSP
ncbi:MAG: hypothetical protein EHM24_17830 [Acidobacteria bacterium]|nr:MAG: hypothetical protein EHM24_17830 [Acidobacteriota bacterium]